MTFIAQVAIRGVPFLIGDLLTSTPDGKSIHLPTIGEHLPGPTNPFGQPAGLCQKVVLVSRNCALAWSGSLVVARRVISDLRSASNRAPLTLAGISAYLTEFDTQVPERDELRLVGLLHDGREIVSFNYKATRIDLPRVDAWIAGSASNHVSVSDEGEVSSFVANMVGQLTESIEPIVGVGHAALMLQSILTMRELVDQSTLQSGYGAGYEIVYFDSAQGKFTKLQDVLNAYSVCHLDFPAYSDGVFVEAPFRLSRPVYSNDILILLQLDRQESDEQNVLFSTPSGYVVADPTSEPSVTAPKNPIELFLNTKWVCWNLLSTHGGVIVEFVPVVMHHPKAERNPFTLSVEGEKLLFNLTEAGGNVIAPILEAIQKRNLQGSKLQRAESIADGLRFVSSKAWVLP
jgi:hypothetical protein